MSKIYTLIGVIIFLNIRKLKASKRIKLFAYIVSIILIFGSSLEYVVYNMKHLYREVVVDYIKPNEEFILFKCKSEDHKTENAYISVNDIYKDKNNDIIADVSLIYKGKESIKLYGNNGFDELSGFYLEAAGIKDRSNSSGVYISISNDIVKDYNPHIDKLDTTISNGDTINIKAPLLIEGSKIEDLDIDDLKFKIHKSYSGSHMGVGSFQYVRLTK